MDATSAAASISPSIELNPFTSAICSLRFAICCIRDCAKLWSSQMLSCKLFLSKSPSCASNDSILAIYTAHKVMLGVLYLLFIFHIIYFTCCDRTHILQPSIQVHFTDMDDELHIRDFVFLRTRQSYRLRPSEHLQHLVVQCQPASCSVDSAICLTRCILAACSLGSLASHTLAMLASADFFTLFKTPVHRCMERCPWAHRCCE